jgi:phosphatidylglycerophosphate synthase
MISSARFRPFYYRFTDPLGKKLAAWGISPNHITLASPFLALISALWIILTKDFLIGGILVLVTDLFDSIDGAVARASQKVTKFGSYLDAMMDRYVDSIILFAVAFSTGYWLLSFIVLFGSLGTSYAKARVAMEVKIDNLNWPQFFERTERCTVLIAGLILQGVFKNQNIIFWALIILAVGTNITVIQRIFRGKAQIQ